MPGATLAAVDIACPDDPTAVYTVWVADGIDPYAHGDYPGDVAVAVDRRTAETTVTYGTADEPVAQTLWDTWNFPTHAGIVVNGWWRLIWFVIGLAPLALAVTGVSTWLVRRKTRKIQKGPGAGRIRTAGSGPAAAQPTPLTRHGRDARPGVGDRGVQPDRRPFSRSRPCCAGRPDRGGCRRRPGRCRSC